MFGRTVFMSAVFLFISTLWLVLWQ